MRASHTPENSSALKGHDFSRAAKGLNRDPALAAEGISVLNRAFPQGLKPSSPLAYLMARLKPSPFKALWLVSLIALGLVEGCKPVGPNYSRPSYTAPPTYKEAGASSVQVPLTPPPNPAGGGWQPATPSDGMLKGKWWEVYQDPQLNNLEEKISPNGKPNNQQLRQAMETYLAAHDQIKVARSALFPTLSAGPSATRNRVSTNQPLFNKADNPSYNDFEITGQASWEPDFWGRVRRTVSAARDTAQASAADMAIVDLSLHAEMASDYFQLRGLDSETKLLTATVADLERQLRRDQTIGTAPNPVRTEIFAAHGPPSSSRGF